MQDRIAPMNSRPAGGPPRVLVVDDDPSIRLVCTTTLRREGYEAIEASNGQEGYERAIAETPDLALLGVQMPELDGFGLAGSPHMALAQLSYL
jgi:DNA-binding response OmpR family regulator